MQKTFLKSFIVFIAVLLSVNSAFCANRIEQKQHETKEKIRTLKILEKIETNKLYQNQQKLEETKQNLYETKQQFNEAQNRLSSYQSELGALMYSYKDLQQDASKRIRNIFKHQRKSYIEFLLGSQDFNTMLDRLYFENLITRQDKVQLNEIKHKARQIATVKNKVEKEQKYISSSINHINKQQKNIQKAINQNEVMISKLKTDRKYYERAERELARQSESISNMIIREEKGGQSIAGVTGRFIRPIAGRLTSSFGYRVHPIFKSRSFHSGIDIGARQGTPIKASNSGKVIYSGWYGGYGKVVIVNHGKLSDNNAYSTLYAHMSNYIVSVGSPVKQGQVVGYVGTTGYSTGPHLHFEVRVNGKVKNPLNYIR